MTYPTYSRANSTLLLIFLSLGLISCAQTQKPNDDAAVGSLYNFWQQEEPLQADAESVKATESIKNLELVRTAEPVKTAESAKTAKSEEQKKSNNTDNDFFSGLTPVEIEKVRMEAWNAYGKNWKTVAKRSQYVRQPLLETLEKVGAPEELQMIPVVESSYDPYAQSEVGATGLWQLMPITAEDLRIKSDQFIDGRREIKTSTRGAARFLLKQRKRFGNWPLAFAAYHLGPSGVQKRINRRPWQPEDGLKKLPLPKITKTYVRHILGLISLYRVGELVFPEPFPTATIRVQTPINLDVLHEKAELPKDQLFRYNPGLNLKHYYGKKSSVISLRVTRWRVPAVKKHLSAKPTEYMTISIREGESLQDIVRRYRTTISELYKANPGNLMQLAKGQMLHIPVKLLKRAKAERNPLVKPPTRLLADNSNNNNLGLSF
jgi:membrane-bound lytic murein transglycosylase D